MHKSYNISSFFGAVSICCIVGFVTIQGCSSPCYELAQKKCDCKKNDPQDYEKCLQEIKARESHSSVQFVADQEKCQEILADPECNCEALHDNDVQACGDTRKSS